jgi:ferredoxin-NADP reductase
MEANHGPILVWCGLAAAAFHGAAPPAAYVAAALLALLGFLSTPPRTTGARRGSLLIATGVDPAALRARLAEAADHASDTVAVYRAERATDELRELEARYGLILVVGAEHDPRVKERVSASGLSREIPDIAEREVVVAGPRPFKRYVGGALSRLAIPKSQIHFKSGQNV